MCVFVSYVCDLRVHVGFECEECICGLVLDVDLVNAGFECELCSLFGKGNRVCLHFGDEHGFCVSVGFDGGFCVNVGVYAFSLVSDARCVLFQFCLRCVDGGFEHKYCIWGLVLNVG